LWFGRVFTDADGAMQETISVAISGYVISDRLGELFCGARRSSAARYFVNNLKRNM